jgi:hypothetical protein
MSSFRAAILALLVIFAWLAIVSRSPVHAGGGYEAGAALSGKTVSVPATVLECGNGITCTFGLYRATLSCMTTTAGNGKVAVSLTWSDFGNVQSVSTSTCALNTVGSNTGITFPLYLDGLVNPKYAATVTAGGPGSAIWRANIVLERLQ